MMAFLGLLAQWFLLPLFMLFDVYYFIRGLAAFLQHHLMKDRKKLDVLDEVVTHGLCWTTDMDFSWHMNNSKYMRECDFGRFKLYMDTGVWDTVASLKGYVTLGGSTIRYRKSLQLFNVYRIRSKILCWDEKAFYIEQRIERSSDGFICAILTCKQVFVKATPEMIVRQLRGQEVASPAFPEHVRRWCEYDKLSSDNLKLERELKEAKDK